MSEAASGMLTLGGWWRLNDGQRIEHKLKKNQLGRPLLAPT